jgi:putative hemolysin
VDSHSWAALAVLILALAFMVVVTAAEAGLVGSSHGRLRFLAERGVPRAETVQGYVHERQALLGALTIARILSVVVVTSLALFIITRQDGGTWKAVAVAAGGSLIVLVLFQSIPRVLVLQSPERWSIILSPVVGALRWAFGRLAWLFELPGRALVRVGALGGKAADARERDDDILHLMEQEEANGGIEEDERQMIRGIINLEETPAREIMVPRIDIVAAEADSDIDTVMQLITERGFSRIPVYEETIDNVVGVVYAKDILRCLADGTRPASLKEIARPPYFVPESKKVDELLAELRQRRVHIAIVVDEYGGTAGLLTIEDLIEEIVGEIEDEYDREEVTVQRISDDEAIVDGRVSLDDLNELLGLDLQGEDFDTVGGFVYHHLGKMPNPGDEVRADGLRLRILSVMGRRIKRVRVSREPPPAEPEGAGPRDT